MKKRVLICRNCENIKKESSCEPLKKYKFCKISRKFIATFEDEKWTQYQRRCPLKRYAFLDIK